MKTPIIVLLVIPSVSLALEDGRARKTTPTYSLTRVLEISKEQQELRACCGPLSLARSLFLLGKEVDFRSLQSEFTTKTARGVEVRELLRVAQKHCPESQALHVPPHSLDDIACPALLIVNKGRHCLVLENLAANDDVGIWDPASLQETTIAKSRLLEVWDGDVILFAKPETYASQNVILGGLSCLNLFLLLCLFRARRKNVSINS